LIGPLGFSHQGDYIGGRAASGGGPAGSPLVARARGRPRHPRVSLAYGPLHLIFDLREASVKIGGSAFVLSNSKNISYVAFLKHKNRRKQGTGTVASR
jgi:hypothetical protein